MKNFIKIFSIVLLGIVTSCETTELDLRDNPNSSTAADVDFLYNAIQTNYGRFVETMGNRGGEVTRVEYMFGRSYQNAYTPQGFNTVWNRAYLEILSNSIKMNEVATESGQFTHIGQAQIMLGHAMMTLVDNFGDVPYSQAGDPVNFPNPMADDGASTYAAAIELIDSGIANINQGAATPVLDLIYDGDSDAWKRAANTIKLRAYLNTRLVDNSAVSKFNAIISSGNFIQNSSQDFVFNWGDRLVDPGQSAHPDYLADYTESGAGNYQSNYLMNYMLGDDKDDGSDDDPRIRYYFFRQLGATPGYGSNPPNQQVLACSEQSKPNHYDAEDPYCALANGYWGRDHGNAEGTPPDGFQKVGVGVYPAAGRIDANYFDGSDRVPPAVADRRVGVGLGGAGLGITPIILASTVDFYRAEIALFENNNANAALGFMTDGITKSVVKVKSFIERDPTASADDIAYVASNTQSTGDFVNSLTAAYNGGGDNTKKDILANQLFVNVFGNGADAYNFYRRTGFPTSLQPNIEANPGGFIRSFLYPANEANTNINLNQKPDVKVQVFWDNNPSSPGFPSAN